MIPKSSARQCITRKIATVVRQHNNPLSVAGFYLVLLTFAELLTVLVDARVGQVIHLVLLFVLFGHIALVWDQRISRFLASLIFVPLMRVISLSLPLAGYPRIYWYFIVGVPLFAAAYVATRSLRIQLSAIGKRDHGLLTQLAFGSTGLLFGTLEYYILRPEPLIQQYTWVQFVIAAAILLVGTGLLEEMIFRGIMQQAAIAQFGRIVGVLYVALVFAILHAGYQSLLDVIFVLTIGLIFGWFVWLTGGLLGVTLSHGLTNIIFFLVIPYWLQTFGALPFLLPPAS
jgi:membrane protease YdiL (CAAX protease family)